MSVTTAIARSWDFALALLAAIIAALWLTPVVIDKVTTEMIAFFTIQSAVILPAMIFTAGLLRGDGLTLGEVERYQAALRRQMHFWVTLLFLDLIAVSVLIIGKAAAWHWKVTIAGYSAEWGTGLMFVCAFAGALAVLRMYPFVRGVMSLLELNGLLVRKAVAAGEKARTQSPSTPAEPLNLPDGYGKILPHTPRRRRGTGN